VPAPWAVIDRPRRAAAAVAALLRRHMRLRGRCLSVSSGKVTLTVSARMARRLELEHRTLGRAGARCRGDGHFAVTIRPTAAAKRALRHYRRAITVTATLRMKGTHGTVRYRRHFKLAKLRRA
jgi:hypothetical protein